MTTTHPSFTGPVERWRNCPSTHCERAQECRSPHECSGSEKFTRFAAEAKAQIPEGTFAPLNLMTAREIERERIARKSERPEGHGALAWNKDAQALKTFDPNTSTLLYEASRDLSQPLKVRGVGRVADEPRALLICLSERPTDDDIRSLHEFLRGWKP